MTSNRRISRLPVCIDPLAEKLLERGFEKDTQPTHSYRVKFSVGRVKPRGLPEFAYVSSEIRFDSVVFTAILQATSLSSALQCITAHWPDAEPREAEEGVRSFRAEDSHLASVQFGATRVLPEVPWYKKMPRFGKRED